MNKEILNERVRKFILDNENADPFSLSLKYKEVDGVPISVIIDQINGRFSAKKKLPYWYSAAQVIYPPKISMEQCSSEQTAIYKSTLASGKVIIDLTGGAGVDLHFFSQNFSEAHYVDKYTPLFEITRHNLSTLGANNVQCHNTTSEHFLDHFSEVADLIYIDPARRADTGKKVFRFEDCEPNVVEMLPELMRKGRQIIIKASPMLDISLAIKDLKFVNEVHVVAVDNECKELLFVLDKHPAAVQMKTVNLRKNKAHQYFDFEIEEETNSNVDLYQKPLKYLFEPNTSILKSGAFKILTKRFDVLKLHPHTHLYTSNKPIPDFPGRAFEIVKLVKFNKKEIAKALPDKKANLAVRNFPEDVHQIKKRLGIKDGGEIYLFACTIHENEKIIIITKKL